MDKQIHRYPFYFPQEVWDDVKKIAKAEDRSVHSLLISWIKSRIVEWKKKNSKEENLNQ